MRDPIVCADGDSPTVIRCVVWLSQVRDRPPPASPVPSVPQHSPLSTLVILPFPVSQQNRNDGHRRSSFTASPVLPSHPPSNPSVANPPPGWTHNDPFTVSAHPLSPSLLRPQRHQGPLRLNACRYLVAARSPSVMNDIRSSCSSPSPSSRFSRQRQADHAECRQPSDTRQTAQRVRLPIRHRATKANGTMIQPTQQGTANVPSLSSPAPSLSSSWPSIAPVSSTTTEPLSTLDSHDSCP